MIVFVLEGGYYNDRFIEGVFSTLENAKAAAQNGYADPIRWVEGSDDQGVWSSHPSYTIWPHHLDVTV